MPITPKPPPPRPSFRWRTLFFIVIFLMLVGIARREHFPFTEALRRTPFFSQPPEEVQVVSREEVLEILNRVREENNLPKLEENASLDKAARLVSLEMEDEQSLEIPGDVKPFLSAVSTETPAEVETFAVFLTGMSSLESMNQVATRSAITQKDFTQIGIATRSATFAATKGTLIVVMSSGEFRNSLSENDQSARPAAAPRFTGQDLWDAVQNYRRAQQLPQFEQANELCTVASIRLNELLELGKLDNHDGFQKRANEFFEREEGWTAINENLASGYETGVQTVEWGWDQSLGHKALIRSTEYPKACTAANRGFAVLITGR